MLTFRGVSSAFARDSAIVPPATMGPSLVPATFSVEIQLKDAKDALRVVGFIEYLQALKRFDTLVATAKPEELTVFDELVRQRSECAIFTNLSRRFPSLPSTLNEVPQGPNDNFERRGLAWIMGLARVEVGAIVASCTYAPDPFGMFPPTKYDFAPYRELVQDGLRTHYWSLATDPGLESAANAKIFEGTILRYIRRLTVAQAFHMAAVRVDPASYNPAQREELAAWGAQLAKIQSLLVGRVQFFLAMKEAQKDRLRELTMCNDEFKRLTARATPNARP